MARVGGYNVSELRRSNLIDRLLDARVGIIEAPGGYGKTTLARQLAAVRGSAFVEITLTRPTGRAGLLDALASSCRRSGHPTLVEAVSDESASAGSSDEPREEFLRAVGRTNEPFWVMIDEMQFLDADTFEMLTVLADSLPARSGVVMSGRRIPDGISALVRRRDAVLVRADDLRLGADDISRLLRDGRETTDIEHGVDLIGEILDATGGWPAAVAIAVATVLNGQPFAQPTPPMQRVGHNVMARLVEQFLAGLEPGLVARIGALAHAPLLDNDVATAISGTGALSQLLDSGLPVLTRADGWVELPDPVQDELVSRHGISRDARRATAAIYARRGLLTVALDLLGDAGDIPGIASVLSQVHWSALVEFAPTDLRLAIDALVTADVAPPMVLVDAARAMELRELDLRTQWLARAVDVSTRDGDHVARNAALAEQARDLVRRGDRDGANALARLVLETPVPTGAIRPGSPAAAVANARARALAVLGVRATLIATPDELAKATDLFEEAIALFRATGEWRWEADTLMRLGYSVSFQWGRLERAVEQVGTALALLPRSDRDRAVALTYFADVLDAAGRSEEAAAAAQESAAVGRRIGDPFVIGCAAWSAMWIAAHRGDLAATRRWLREVDRNPGRWLEEASGCEFLLAASDALAMMGDEEGSRTYLERGTRVVEALQIADVLAPAQARYEASFGDPVGAERILAALEGAPFAVERARWIRYALRALAAHRRNDRDAARTFAEQAMIEADSIGIHDALATHEPWIAHQLATILPPQTVAATGSSGVRIQLLGGFAVTDGVRDITPAPGRPSLLVKLVATRGTMTNDEVIDILWPEVDLAAGRARLRNLLNRLRTHSRDVISRQGESLVLASGVEVDATRFELLAAAALNGRPAERVGLSRHALSLYPGELLPGDRYEDWVIAIRERMRRRYLALADLVADDAIERGDLDDSIHLLDGAIAAEPMDEARYVKAASALIRQGRRGTARDLVDRAVRLADELGLRLGVELIGLRDELATTGRR